jgi:hypothetical protein
MPILPIQAVFSTPMHPGIFCRWLCMLFVLGLPSVAQAQLRRIQPMDQPKVVPLLSMPLVKTERKPGVVAFSSSTTKYGVEPVGFNQIRLIDGTEIPAEPMSIQGGSLVAKLSAGPEVTLNLAAVASISLANPIKSEARQMHLLLRDGTTLPISDVALVDEQITCQILGGGGVKFPRAAVAELVRTAEPGEGFASTANTMRSWVASPPQSCQPTSTGWMVDPKQERGSVAQSFNWPTRFLLEFDTNQTDFGLTLFRGSTDGPVSYGHVSMLIENNALSISQYDGQWIHAPAVRQQLYFMEGTRPVHHAIYGDILEGRFEIVRGGVYLGRFDVSKVPVRSMERFGRSINFIGRGGCEFSNMRVSPWLGLVPPKSLAVVEEDTVEVGSERIATGRIASISATEIQLSDGTSILRNQPFHIHFAGPAVSAVPADYRVTTVAGGGIGASMVRLAKGSLEMKSAAGILLTLPLTAVRTISLPRAVPWAAIQERSWNTDVLTFLDGSQLAGTLLTMQEPGQVRWKISASPSVSSFPVGELAGIKMMSGAEPPPPDFSTVVAFQNGDWLNAQLLKVQEEQLELRTAYRPAFMVPRKEVQAIYHPPAAQSIVAGGPSSDWELATRIYNPTRRAYSFERSQVNVARYFDGEHSVPMLNRVPNRSELLCLKLPEIKSAMAVEFTMPWGDYNAQLCGVGDTSLFSIYISTSTIRITRQSEARNGLVGAVGFMGRSESYSFAIPTADRFNSKLRHIQLVFDPLSKRISVASDGKAVGVCKLNSSRPLPEIRKLFWVSMSSRPSSDLVVSDVWIHPSPGLLSEQEAPTAEHPWVALNNGDNVIAQSYHFANDAWHLDTPEFGVLEIPIDRISAVVFAPRTRPKSDAPCCVRLVHGGCLSGTNSRLEMNGVHLESWLGEFVIPLAQITEWVRIRPKR